MFQRKNAHSVVCQNKDEHEEGEDATYLKQKRTIRESANQVEYLQVVDTLFRKLLGICGFVAVHYIVTCPGFRYE
jgi:hypothetical protein